jgi:uncharacterized protein YbjT (DUF2867 family)
MAKCKVVLYGSSGLVGSAVRQRFEAHPLLKEASLVCPSRNGLGKIDFEDSQALDSIHEAASAVVWCVGTTLKKAGSKEAFEDVDFVLPKRVFSSAQKMGVLRVFLVSAEGANAASPFFYSRVKAKLENFLKDLGFIESVVYRPSLLIGPRAEPRALEELGQKILPRLPWALLPGSEHLRPILAQDVAAAIVNDLAAAQKSGHRIVRSGEMQGS